ncbi:MAG TPA: DUF4440 domain-containing protein [Kofleriaceae bacterium]|nr:DUF4440 domain-containing protein [Kofleriaceae bacterium]
MATALTLALSHTARAEEDVAALIKRQSQEFSDASAGGDTKVFEKYLDDDVVFMNENGEIATKRDLVGEPAPASAAPSAPKPKPGPVQHTLVQNDFTIKLHGNVAVTSFTDESTVQIHDQVQHARFRSIEVWMKKPRGWLMISSQTLAENTDPPAVTLPPRTMAEYIGTYKVADDFVYKIARAGDGLVGSLNGAPPSPIKAEVADVLFTPGQPRLRKIIQRDARGKVTGFVSRREGHDLVFKRAG